MAALQIPPQPAGWPRGGTEAYGIRVRLTISRPSGDEHLDAFLKVFKTDVTERAERVKFLINMELAKKNEFFYGIPFGWLGRLDIAGIELIAHFTRMMPGPFAAGPEDFGRLRGDGRWDAVSMDSRRKFSGEVAAAIAGLERAGIVHGDISPGNMIVGQSSAGSAICFLCDYDGYYHPLSPRLPRRVGRTPCRPMGSPGYQYPDLVGAITDDADGNGDVWVETDRFALGIAICEMMIWSTEVEEYLAKEGRGQLITDEVIRHRDLSLLPKYITDAFPGGFGLVDKALRASAPNLMPSPEDWLRILGLEAKVHQYKGRPRIIVFRGQGNVRARHCELRIAADHGDFGKAAPELSVVSYTFKDGRLEFWFDIDSEIKRRREGRLASVISRDGVCANPKDVFYLGGWQLEVEES